MLLHRTSLFHPSTPPPPPQSPQHTLPNSYRVAIFLDATILILTFVILIGAVLYLRIRRSSNGKGRRMSVDEEETLLESKYETGDSQAKELKEGRIKHTVIEIREKSFSPGGGGIMSPSIFLKEGDRKNRKKKGHIRWTPSVQGGEVFGIAASAGTNGEGKEGKKCKCKGRRHPGCWRFELEFEGDMPVLGEEREEGMGRERMGNGKRRQS